MKCPKCTDSTLKPTNVSKAQLELDRCPQCHGVWFDKEELTRVLGKRGDRNAEIPKFATYQPKVLCPKCHEGLYEYCYPKTLVLVDACQCCSGIWLDDQEWKQISEERNPDNQMTCPKCGKEQKKESTCSQCGIAVDKYEPAPVKEADKPHKEPDRDTIDSGNYIKALRTSNVFKQLEFVREELKDLPGITEKPSGGVKSFLSRVGYALSLGFKEKEIFVFGLLQWATVMLTYLLWVQMLDWIPEEVWRSAEDSDSGSIADYILLAWSFLCIGLAAFPIGLLTGCMGATHFLHRQGQESTIAKCLHLVLPQSWSLWIFHWIDGWITVNQIVDRLPKSEDDESAAEKAASEALYYAWKMGVAGVLPGILTGNSLIRSGKYSIFFVKHNFIEVAKLRAGYSALCWIVGIAAYIGMIFLLLVVDIIPENEETYSHIYTFYMWAGIPILVAVSIVMLLLRPIYVIAICDLYSEYLESQNKSVAMRENVSKPTSALVAFGAMCIIVGAIFLFRDELGITEMLSTPYEQKEAASLGR